MEKILLKIGDTDRSGRPLSDRFIHFWNGTTPAEVENIKLKEQVDYLIRTLSTSSPQLVEVINQMKELKEQIQPLSKALNYKVLKGKKINKKQAILEQFRASQLL